MQLRGVMTRGREDGNQKDGRMDEPEKQTDTFDPDGQIKKNKEG